MKFKKLPHSLNDHFQVEVFENYKALNQLPVIIWNYSNLIFYDLIFLNYNSSVARDLSADQAKKII